MIKVLIVDDSASVRQFFRHQLSLELDFEVVGCAGTGQEALSMVKELRPNVVAMDVNLPDSDGFAVTRKIMEENPVPIVIISSVYNDANAEHSFKMMDTGALAFHRKPIFKKSDFKEQMNEIVTSLRIMSEVKVVRRKRVGAGSNLGSRGKNQVMNYDCESRFNLICIGASTGGPQALKTLLSQLPPSLKLPVVIVQHISSGFLEGMVDWLNSNTGHSIKIATHGETLQNGVIYFAPENYHMRVTRDKQVSLLNTPAVNGIRPAVNELFSSAAKNMGSKQIGILLTGMGSDGASGLLEIKESGGYTIAQDKESSIVFGMPGAAVRLDAVKTVLPINQISEKIVSLVGGCSGD